jgi:hypothetical protein
MISEDVKHIFRKMICIVNAVSNTSGLIILRLSAPANLTATIVAYVEIRSIFAYVSLTLPMIRHGTGVQDICTCNTNYGMILIFKGAGYAYSRWPPGSDDWVPLSDSHINGIVCFVFGGL